MNDYIRDRRTGALIFVNEEKERDFMEKNRLQMQVETMKNEINTLKSLVNELLSKRN